MSLVLGMLNSSQSAFFERQLESIKSQTRDVLYAPYRAFDIIPTSGETPPGARSVTWYQYDRLGQARIIANGSKVIPRVDIIGKQETTQVREIADKFGYTVDDIEAARMAGVNLDTKKRDVAEDAIMRKMSSIAFLGDATHNLIGLLTHPNVPAVTPVNKASGSDTEWDTTGITADQLYADLVGLYNQIVVTSKGNHIPNTLAAPPSRLQIVRQTRMSTNTDTTVLEYFLRNFPAITSVEDVPELTGAGTAGADVAIMFQADPMVLQHEVPLMFQMLPPQAKDLDLEIICRGKTAGVLIYYPLALATMEGI